MTAPRQAAIDEAREKARALATFTVEYGEDGRPDYTYLNEELASEITAALLRARAQGIREAADWLESNGQPGYAIELRARAHADELEAMAKGIER